MKNVGGGEKGNGALNNNVNIAELKTFYEKENNLSTKTDSSFS